MKILFQIRRWVFFYLIILCAKSNAQDAQLSQYYSSFTYLNPALAGVIDNTKLGVQYRSQWNNVESPYTSTLVYAGHYLERSKLAFSFTYLGNEEGVSSFQQDFLMFGSSYTFNLNDKVRIVPALQVGYNMEQLNSESFVFGDQLTSGGVTQQTQEDFSGTYSVNYLDFNSGILIVGDKAFIGFSASHLTEPNNSVFGTDDQLSRKYNLHTGYKLIYNEAKERSWIITGLYKSQGKFDQLDLGTYIDAKVMAIGLWYRGLPFIKDFGGITNNESIVGMAGIKIKSLQISYSYDYVLSNLSSNAHEIALNYEFRINKKQVEPKRGLPIPMF